MAKTSSAAPQARTHGTARAAGVKAGASRSRLTPLTPMRVQAAKSMTKLADHMKESHPDMLAHQHVRDAARMLRSGNEEAAQRHLRAAMFAMTPQSLMRNGLHTDDDHIAARDAMHAIHRHLLLTKDITDVAAKNQQAIRRDSGDGFTTPPAPDPNNGFGPGALAQKPTARQPPGDQALNAPNRTNSGGSDPAAADPAGPQPKGSKQFTTRNGVRTVTDLAYGWDDLAGMAARVIEMSAETAALEVTPAPRGKPGGPGLYGVKDNMHSPYLQQIVKALIAKGMDPGKAYAVAWGSMRRWERGGGKVTPEVRAAAAGGLALEKVAEARATGHSNVRTAVELVGPKGFSHGWVFHGTADMAPEDKADKMSKNISRHAFSDGPDGDEAKSANREAAKAHRQAAKLSSSPSAVAHHQKMAKLHSAVAGGKMYSANAEKQMSFARTWDDVLRVLEFVQRPGYRVIELDWAAWNAGESSGASQKAHDTASRTASRDAKAKIAADKLHSVAGQADSDFPSAKPGSEIHAAAESFAKGDAEGANTHLDNARAKLRTATEVAGKSSNRFGQDPVVRKQIALDSTLRTGKGQAQMMADQQDDDAKADAKDAKKAAKAQAHANVLTRNGIDLAAAPPAGGSSGQSRVPAGSAGGGEFGSGGAPAKQQQSGAKSIASQTASKNIQKKIAASKQSKAGLLGQAASDKKQAAGLSAKRKTLQAQLAALSSASGATSSGQAGSTTSSGASTTASSAPAATAASTTASTASTAASSTASTAASAASPTAAQLTTQIGALTTQINTLLKSAAQASAQAAKM